MSDDVKINKNQKKYYDAVSKKDSLQNVIKLETDLLELKKKELNEWLIEQKQNFEQKDSEKVAQGEHGLSNLLKEYIGNIYNEPNYDDLSENNPNILKNPQFQEIQKIQKEIENLEGNISSQDSYMRIAVRKNQQDKWKKEYKRLKAENPGLSKEEMKILANEKYPNARDKNFDWGSIDMSTYEFARGGQVGSNGGLAEGPSHANGGIDIEVEGGEVVINKNRNNAAGKHEKDLLNLNKNPDDYQIVKKGSYKDGGYVYPTFDARKRGK